MKHYAYMGNSHDPEIARHLLHPNICYSFHKTCQWGHYEPLKVQVPILHPTSVMSRGTSASHLRLPNRARRLKRQVPGSNPEHAIYYHGCGLLVFSNLPGKSHNISFRIFPRLLAGLIQKLRAVDSQVPDNIVNFDYK
jgi:hypothetical protein